MKTKLFILLRWLVYWWYPSIQSSSLAIDELFHKVCLWSSTKGDLWVISHLKELRLLYTRHLCGHPVHTSTHIIGIRKDGLPKGFPVLNSIYLSGDRRAVSFILTLLSISRAIPAWKIPDLKSISENYTGQVTDFSIYEPFIKTFMKDFKIKGGHCITWNRSNLYFSTKAGPNGVATWHSILDAIAIKLNAIDLFKKLKVLSYDLYLYALTLSSISAWRLDKDSQSKPIIRKLSVVKDPEGKSRIIAILDYFSQNVLVLIHKHVFSILKSLSQDRTFTQNPIVDFVGPYYSLDLSAATDRFPLAFQKLVMSYLYSGEIADAWSSILVDHEFVVPFCHTGKESKIRYAVGQPMGAYSSWAVFALSHHIVVQLAAKRVGLYPTKDYILLGDDIVIGGEILAESYKDLMAELGVEISSHKTHVSSNTYEFAKRWFSDGREVSGMQVNAFMETWKHHSLLYMTIRQYIERGFIPTSFTSTPEIIFSLYLTFGVRLRQSLNIYRKVEVLHALYRWINYEDIDLMRYALVKYCSNLAVIPSTNNLEALMIFIIIRLNYTFEVMHTKTVNRLEGYLDTVESKMMDMVEDQADFVRIMDGEIETDRNIEDDILTPSDMMNHPTTCSLRNLWKVLSEDERLTNPELDYSSAIKALVVPDPERLGQIRTAYMVSLVTNKLAQKLFESINGPFSRHGWMIEARWFSDHSDS